MSSFPFLYSTVCECPSPGLTHDLSLPLCLSKSRFPRESKPSPRPMPRPLPPRPPRPPPRPLGGLSPEGLMGHKQTISALKKTVLQAHVTKNGSPASKIVLNTRSLLSPYNDPVITDRQP